MTYLFIGSVEQHIEVCHGRGSLVFEPGQQSNLDHSELMSSLCKHLLVVLKIHSVFEMGIYQFEIFVKGERTCEASFELCSFLWRKRKSVGIGMKVSYGY